MYAFESSGSRKPLHLMVVGAFVAAVILFSISNREGVPMPLLWQVGALICLTAAVYLLVRYSLRLYRYAIEQSGIIDAYGVEQCDLVITEMVGKKMTVVARVALRDIDRGALTVVRRSDAASDRDKAKQAVEALCRDRRVYRYENTPVSPASCYIPLPEEGAVVVIPADTRMVGILTGQSRPS